MSSILLLSLSAYTPGLNTGGLEKCKQDVVEKGFGLLLIKELAQTEHVFCSVVRTKYCTLNVTELEDQQVCCISFRQLEIYLYGLALYHSTSALTHPSARLIWIKIRMMFCLCTLGTTEETFALYVESICKWWIEEPERQRSTPSLHVIQAGFWIKDFICNVFYTAVSLLVL